MSASTRASVSSGRHVCHRRRLSVIVLVCCCLVASLLQLVKDNVAFQLQHPSARINRRLIVRNANIGDKEFTDDEISRFRVLFTEFDKDGDGEITSTEIRAIMSRLGAWPKEGELQDLLRDFCKGNTGAMEFDGFCNMMLRKVMDADNEHYDEVGAVIRDFVRKTDQAIAENEDHRNSIPSKAGQAAELSEDTMERYRLAFSKIDLDADGVVNIDEIGSVMRKLGMYPKGDELQQVIKDFDEDASGTIDFSEFCLLLSRKRKGHGGNEDDEEEMDAMFREAAQMLWSRTWGFEGKSS